MERPDPADTPPRPPEVMPAALILMVLGALGLFANVFLALHPEQVLGISPGVLTAIAVAGAVVSGLEVAAGVMVLRLSNRWRRVGIAVATLGAVAAGVNAFSAGFLPLLGVAGYVYVVAMLVATRAAFVR